MTTLKCKACNAAANIVYTAKFLPEIHFQAECDHDLGCPLATHAITSRTFRTAFDAVEAWQATHDTPDQPSEKGASQ